jgi:arabinan endo-1,5-alpha-L-arabinosidase
MAKSTWTASVVLIAQLLLTAPLQGENGLARRVHDPAIIKADGLYYVFATGRGIPIRQSKDLVGWQEIGRVFESPPEWTRQEIPNARGFWAPDISFFDGEYHLYYAVSTFGQNRSCIGLATNKTLDPTRKDYKWIDRGKVIESTSADNWNAIDPNILVDETQRVWLSFGSFWSGIKLCEIDRHSGKPASGYRLISLAERPQEKSVEAPFLIRHGDYYYLFVSFDHCCRGIKSDYRIMVGRSKAVIGPVTDKDGRQMLDGGGSVVVAGEGAIRGPGHCAVLSDDDKQWLVYHFYDADDNGTPWLRIQSLAWTADGWPKVGDAIAPKSGSAGARR